MRANGALLAAAAMLVLAMSVSASVNERAWHRRSVLTSALKSLLMPRQAGGGGGGGGGGGAALGGGDPGNYDPNTQTVLQTISSYTPPMPTPTPAPQIPSGTILSPSQVSGYQQAMDLSNAAARFDVSSLQSSLALGTLALCAALFIL